MEYFWQDRANLRIDKGTRFFYHSHSSILRTVFFKGYKKS